MKIIRTLGNLEIRASGCAMGMFDGIHLGHRMVLEQAIRVGKIKQLQTAVFTFANHPQSVISQTPTPLLSTMEERLEIFRSFGFEYALVLDFTPELKEMSPEAFVKTILQKTLKVQSLSVGYDHRFGKDRRGDGAFLKAQGDENGFEVNIIEPVKVGQQIVSSTLIRKLLSYGDLQKANQLLGRPYHITGEVIPGEGRGKSLGFPTANLQIGPERLLPAQGVYVGLAQINGKERHPAVCNIGVAPTFGDQPVPRVEVHILEHEEALYGKKVSFHFLEMLRTEKAFASVDELIRQINEDCRQAQESFHTQKFEQGS